jgi:hypothetical protein
MITVCDGFVEFEPQGYYFVETIAFAFQGNWSMRDVNTSPMKDASKGVGPRVADENADGVADGVRGSGQLPRLMRESLNVRPMEAVVALYSEGSSDLAEAVLSCLSRAVFEQTEPPTANLVKRVLARANYRLLKRTTVRVEAGEGGRTEYRNRLLERSKHPYARTLLATSSKETEALVEGGDPMNGPYMMIAPEIRQQSNLWDKLFFNSVQGRDVQLRFIWETKATYEEAKRRLDLGMSVQLKALAAGTGLSMILAYDRLISEGYDPARISVNLTDRDSTNTFKSRLLLGKLAPFRGWKVDVTGAGGVFANTEDIFHQPPEQAAQDKNDLVTAIGILEYLQGVTLETTERRHGLPEPEEVATARHLAERLCALTRHDGALIVNTYRPHSSTRILELFGKRFDYRDIRHLTELMAGTQFGPPKVVGSGLIYDVKLFQKNLPAAVPLSPTP